MKLCRVALENFRCFEKAQFDLKDPDEKDFEVPLDVAVLVGGNGSGKSSVLGAISGEFTALWSKFGGEPLGAKDIRQSASQARIEITWLDRLKGARGRFAVRTIVDDSGVHPDDEFDQTYKPWINAASAPSRASTGLIVAFDVHRLIQPRRVTGPNIDDVVTHRGEGALAPTISSDGTTIRPRAQGLKQWIVNLDYSRTKAKVDYGRDLPTWDILRNALNTLLAPYTFEGVDDQFRVFFRTPTGRVPLEALSDGFRSVFVIVTDLVLRMSLTTNEPEHVLDQEAICLVDEIDAHLHPRWQETVIPGLRAMFPNVQFIVTTHSEIVVSTVEPKNVFRLKEANTFTADRQDQWFQRPARSTVSIAEEIFEAPAGTKGRQWVLDPPRATQRRFWQLFGSRVHTGPHRVFVAEGPVLLEGLRDVHEQMLPGLEGVTGSASLFFVDEQPDANWSHACTYFLFPDTGEPLELKHRWPPSDDVRLIPTSPIH